MQDFTKLLRQPSIAALEAALAGLPPAQRERAPGAALYGEILRRREDYAAAIPLLRQAVAAEPEWTAVRHCLALAYLQSGNRPMGRAALLELLAHDSNDPVARYQIALSLEADGEPQAARRLYEEQVARHPASVQAWHNLGLLRLTAHDAKGAVEAFGQAVAHDPRHFNAWMGLAAAHSRAGASREAVVAWLEAHKLRPREVAPLERAAAALGELAELPPAIRFLEQAIALEPANPRLRHACAAHLSSLGEHAAALACLREALALDPGDARGHSAVLVELQYDAAAITPEALAAEHRHWAEKHADPVTFSGARGAAPRQAHRRRRVGYVSPRFGLGPLATLFLPVLEAHDRDRFEVRLYSAHRSDDPITARMHSAADAWAELPSDDAAAASMLASDGLDLVIDLAGHAPGSRLLALAARPARVQATWLDYFDTTGMAAIDYLIGDPVQTPPREAAHFRERLVLLPCRFVYRPLEPARATPAPSSSQGHITFGSFNRHAKIGGPTLRAWRAILDAVPDSRLVLRGAAYNGASTVAWLRGRWETFGMPLERIDFQPYLPWNDALAAYAQIDIALDPFPYNGGVTTCDALFHGVPVVALAGDRMIARQSASLLAAAGHAEWVAADIDAYVRTAVDLANPERLSPLRASLHDAMPRTALGDVAGFTRRLESAFQTMIDRDPRARLEGPAEPPLVVS